MLLVFMKCLLILLIPFRYLINLCRTFHNVPINAVGSVGTIGKIEKKNKYKGFYLPICVCS